MSSKLLAQLAQRKKQVEQAQQQTAQQPHQQAAPTPKSNTPHSSAKSSAAQSQPQRTALHPAHPKPAHPQQQQQQQQQQQPGGKKRKLDAAASDDASGARQSDAASSQPKQKKQKNGRAGSAASAAASSAAASAAPSAAAPAARPRPLSALQQKMASKLAGARFRWLNEKLYTCSGSEAYAYFSAHPEEFAEYHKGFGVQVQDWPVNPLDHMIEWVRARPASLVVGDFGCGEARLAESVPNTVHSFDLVAHTPRVTACNIAHVPLAAGSLDVAVFCLSLMGVDFAAFLREAHRCLRPAGALLVAEVRSRFEGGAAAGGLDAFVRSVCEMGFGLRRKEVTNAMFAEFEFVKEGGKGTGVQADGNKGAGQSTKKKGGKQAGKAADRDHHAEGNGPAHSHTKQKGAAGHGTAGQPAASVSSAGQHTAKTSFTHPATKGAARGVGGDETPVLAPCIYKKR